MLSRHHQIALVDRCSDRVLVVPTADGWRLPRHPDRWPGHRDLVSAVGDPTALLTVPPWREDDGTVTSVLLGAGASTLEGASWRALDALDDLGLSAETVRGLRRSVREHREHREATGGSRPPDDLRADWFRPGWHEQVEAWVDHVLDSLGIERRGGYEAIKIWSLSAVLRFPVRRDGRDTDVWFKATCRGFHGEPALTGAISGLAPKVTPTALAVDADRAWMLLEPIPGADDDADSGRAPDIARVLARLQLDTLDDRDALLAAGAPHRGLEATLEWLHRVVHESVEQPLMTPAQRAAAVEIEPWLAEKVRDAWSHGLPDTLSHGDLHLGNVAWVDHRPVLFDWTDACLTHPFLDARHLADNAAETGGEEARQAVWEAYAEPWRAAYPHVDHDRAWADAYVAEAVFQMISYEQIYRAQPEGSRWELATIVVEILDLLGTDFRAR